MAKWISTGTTCFPLSANVTHLCHPHHPVSANFCDILAQHRRVFPANLVVHGKVYEGVAAGVGEGQGEEDSVYVAHQVVG